MHNSVGLCWCRAGIGDTCLALVTDRSTETLPSLRHVSYAAEGTTFVSALMDSHTTRSIALSVLWHTDAHKYDQGHMVACQGYPQALLRKSYMCDKWSEGLPISRVWWCFRINCKVLCLVYYCSVGPYIPFIFLIGYFPDSVKITKIQTIFKTKHAVWYAVSYLLCSKYLKPLIFLNSWRNVAACFSYSTLK